MLTVDELAPIMRCLSCNRDGLEKRASAVVCPHCEKRFPVKNSTIVFDDAQGGMSDEWRELQRAGEAEYAKGSGVSVAEQGIDPIAQLFGGFMAVTLRAEHRILDIGGGVHSDLPVYVRDIAPQGYISLEPIMLPAKTPFPLLMGAVAEKLPFASHSLDAVMFATSQDHIEGIDEAMAETRRVLKPGGRAYMWIGLYDPDTIATNKTFDVIWRGSPAKKAVRFMAAQVEYAHTLWKMRARRKKLAAGARLDPYHCRYYTRDRVTADVKKWGFTETRRVEVPGSYSLFVEATPC